MTFHLRLTLGTQVLVPPRAKAGVIKEIIDRDDETTYVVAHADGTEGRYARVELKIRRQEQLGALGPRWKPEELFTQLIPDTVAFKCIVGSQAYGLSHETSDVDTRGMFVAPLDLVWSLQGAPDHLELGENDEVYWEITHFCILALKANPNLLECLYTPKVEFTNEIGDELLNLKTAFLSKLVHTTYNGYVLSQFKKIEQDLRNQGKPKWKHVMHLLRLLISGTNLVKDGIVTVDVGDLREQLLSIRRGEVPWDDVEAWRHDLQMTFDRAIESSPLPDLPDYERVEQFVLDVRRRQAGQAG